MRICFFGLDLDYRGGVQNLSTNLIKHMSANKSVDEVFVICDEIDGEIYKSIKHRKLRIHCLGRAKRSDFIRTVLRNIKYNRLQKELDKYDVFHVLDDRALPLATPNVYPLVLTVHDFMLHEFLIQLRKIGSAGLGNLPRFVDHYQSQLFLEFLSIAKANRVMVNSPIIAERLRRFYHNIVVDKIEVIPPGFDPKKFNPHFMSKSEAKRCLKLDPSSKILLHIGGDKLSSRRKGLPHILQALQYMRGAGKLDQHDILLFIVGEFPENCMQQFSELRERIVHLHYAPDDLLPTIYRAADAFVMPSTSEGWGIALIQALACGTLVIASRNVPSAFATQGTRAVFIEPEVDNSERFAKSILEKTNSSNLRNKDWDEIFDFLVHRYSWETLCESYLNVYREIVN